MRARHRRRANAVVRRRHRRGGRRTHQPLGKVRNNDRDEQGDDSRNPLLRAGQRKPQNARFSGTPSSITTASNPNATLVAARWSLRAAPAVQRSVGHHEHPTPSAAAGTVRTDSTTSARRTSSDACSGSRSGDPAQATPPPTINKPRSKSAQTPPIVSAAWAHGVIARSSPPGRRLRPPPVALRWGRRVA